MEDIPISGTAIKESPAEKGAEMSCLDDYEVKASGNWEGLLDIEASLVGNREESHDCETSLADQEISL
ncbi:hypothetical protein VNO80_21721 [Phaseolus coccineus]|uniref:Uncharacterized protein n=1 Tax=Phaseolus coccineus TaxID=3886 RepID=A0AAN9QTL1_PHACN